MATDLPVRVAGGSLDVRFSTRSRWLVNALVVAPERLWAKLSKSTLDAVEQECFPLASLSAAVVQRHVVCNGKQPGLEAGFAPVAVQVHGRRINVGEDRHRIIDQHRSGCRRHGQRRSDHLVAGTHSGHLQRQSERGRYLRHPFTGVSLAMECGVSDAICHIISAHAGEGDMVKRSVEAYIVHHADFMSFEPFTNL